VAIQIFPGLLNYVRNDDLYKALLFKEGLGEVIKKLPFNTPLLGAGII
jgi:hypothetical protein